MLRLSNARLDYLIAEDVPYFDLTATVLGISETKAEMEFFTRVPCMLCGIEVVRGLARNLGCEIVRACNDGDMLSAGDTFMKVSGSAGAVHQLWKPALNTFDHLSAVATKTHAMVEAVHAVNPQCEVLTTRKSMPGAKDLLIEAILVGGAYPHRLGLSETVMIFDHHYDFLGGFDAFVEQLPAIRRRCIEKKIFVEASEEEARVLAHAGVDGIQLDKIRPEALTGLVKELREIAPQTVLIATGGINPGNAAEYAACGVDGLATTALYTAAPLDMSVRIRA